MSARSSSLLGYGLYFIDVLACLLFAITLALVGARFGQELTVPVDLPRAQPAEGAGADLGGTAIVLRSEPDARLQIYLGEDPVSLEELAERLRAATPARVIVRSEETLLSNVIAAAHAAGVADIQLAYQPDRNGGETR